MDDYNRIRRTLRGLTIEEVERPENVDEGILLILDDGSSLKVVFSSCEGRITYSHDHNEDPVGKEIKIDGIDHKDYDFKKSFTIKEFSSLEEMEDFCSDDEALEELRLKYPNTCAKTDVLSLSIIATPKK